MSAHVIVSETRNSNSPQEVSNETTSKVNHESEEPHYHSQPLSDEHTLQQTALNKWQAALEAASDDDKLFWAEADKVLKYLLRFLPEELQLDTVADAVERILDSFGDEIYMLPETDVQRIVEDALSLTSSGGIVYTRYRPRIDFFLSALHNSLPSTNQDAQNVPPQQHVSSTHLKDGTIEVACFELQPSNHLQTSQLPKPKETAAQLLAHQQKFQPVQSSLRFVQLQPRIQALIKQHLGKDLASVPTAPWKLDEAIFSTQTTFFTRAQFQFTSPIAWFDCERRFIKKMAIHSHKILFVEEQGKPPLVFFDGVQPAPCLGSIQSRIIQTSLIPTTTTTFALPQDFVMPPQYFVVLDNTKMNTPFKKTFYQVSNWKSLNLTVGISCDPTIQQEPQVVAMFPTSALLSHSDAFNTITVSFPFNIQREQVLQHLLLLQKKYEYNHVFILPSGDIKIQLPAREVTHQMLNDIKQLTQAFAVKTRLLIPRTFETHTSDGITNETSSIQETKRPPLVVFNATIPMDEPAVKSIANTLAASLKTTMTFRFKDKYGLMKFFFAADNTEIFSTAIPISLGGFVVGVFEIFSKDHAPPEEPKM